MGHQLYMFAARKRVPIQWIRSRVEKRSSGQITKITKSPDGWSGFCMVHPSGQTEEDESLTSCIRECADHVEGLKFYSDVIGLDGAMDIPTEKSLLDAWAYWLSSSEEIKREYAGDLDEEQMMMFNCAILEQAPAIMQIVQQKADTGLEEIGEKQGDEPSRAGRSGKGSVDKPADFRGEAIAQAKRLFKIQSSFRNPMGLFETLAQEGPLRDGLPLIFWDAIDLASRPRECEQALDLLKKIVPAVSTGHEDDQKLNRLKLLADADPALFLPFCRPKPVKQGKLPDLFDNLEAALQKRFFGRRDLVQAIATNLIRRLTGDETVLTPLLHGPPGTGKSFLVTQLAAALSEAGIRSSTVFQAMTEAGSRRGDEQVIMQLTGVAAHYSNSTCGSIYRSAKSRDHRLALVLLDEAEKCDQRNFLVNLLDPRLPLEDCCIKGLTGNVNMRSKTVFFLSANDTAPLCQGPDDPLWSRLDPTFLRPYTFQELEELLLHQVKTQSPFNPGTRKSRKVVKNVLARHGTEPGLRKLLNEVNNALFLDSLGRQDCLACSDRSQPVKTANPIGFRI